MNTLRNIWNTIWKHKVISGIVLVIVVIFLGTKVFGNKTQKPQYQTATAEKGTLVVSIKASGQVTSANNSPVNTQASGVVTKVYVRNGDPVTAGQKIVELQLDTEGKRARAAAYASYLGAISSERNAENSKLSADATMWNDQQSLLLAQNTVNNRNSNNTNPSTKTTYTDLEWRAVDSALITAQKKFAATETTYKQADASVNSAKASITSTQLAYQLTSPTIVAPVSGIMDGFSLGVGEVVTPIGTTTTTSQKIGTIRSNATPRITFNLTEIDVPKIKIGNNATLTFDAFPGKTYTGKVVSIDSSGAVASGVTTYPTVIKLDTDIPGLFTNMTATANIIIQTKDNVVLVPTSAVQNQGTQTTVRTLKNGQLQSVPVEAGEASDTQTEIISGISEGDSVVTSVVNSSGSSSSQGSSPFSRGFGGPGGGGGARVLTGGRGG